MKWLLFEEGDEKPLLENISKCLKSHNQNVRIVRNLIEAFNALTTNYFNYVVIYHTDFKKVDYLHMLFPSATYCALGANPSEELLGHYHRAIPSNSIDEFVKDEVNMVNVLPLPMPIISKPL
jgi:hypothetical protein